MKRWSDEQWTRAKEQAVEYRFDPPDVALLDELVADYEAVTGVPVHRPAKRRLIAVCWRIHGPGLKDLWRQMYALAGTETNLLGHIRARQPGDSEPPVPDAPGRPATHDPGEPEYEWGGMEVSA